MYENLVMGFIIGVVVGFIVGIMTGMSSQLRSDAAASLKNDPLDYEWSIAVHRAQIDAQIAAERK